MREDQLTEHDWELIKKAQLLRDVDWREVYNLMEEADTQACVIELGIIQQDMIEEMRS